MFKHDGFIINMVDTQLNYIYQLNLTMATNEKVRRLFAIMLIIVSLTTDTILVHIHPLLEKLLL